MVQLATAVRKSQPPSLENPFVGSVCPNKINQFICLNLQAWRIPLWADLNDVFDKQSNESQPPSLENPFVGDAVANPIGIAGLKSQPPSLENPFVGGLFSL